MKKKIFSVALGATATVAGLATLSGCGKTVNLDKIIQQVTLTIDNKKVTDDFKVPSYVSNGKKNYKITWESDNTDLLTFSYVEDDKNTKDVDESLEDATVKITRPTDELKEVTFRATIKSGKKVAKSDNFRVRIERQLTAEEQFKYYYDNAAENTQANISGYVIAKAGKTTFNDKGECCLYIASDEYEAGAYYIYNAYMEHADYDALAVGDYVTVTGTKFTVYNGIVEVSGGDVAKDASKTPLTAEEVAAKTVDITDTLLASSNRDEDLLYIQGHNVKVNGAKVVEISEEKYVSATGKYLSTMQNIITVEVNGNTLDIVLEEGLTGFAEDATKTIFEEVQKLEVGDYVNVEGYLVGTSAIAITAKNKVAKATATPTWGKVADVVAENEFSNFYAEAATLNLATAGVSTTDVAITWALKGTPSTAKIENGQLVITPVKDSEESVTLVGTFTLGEFTKTVEYKFKTLLLTTEEQLDYEANKLKFKDTYPTYYADIELLPTGATLKNVTVTYEITEGATGAKVVDKEEGKYLVFLSVDKDTECKLKVTFAIGETKKEKEYTFTVKNPDITTVISSTEFAVPEDLTESFGLAIVFGDKASFYTGKSKDTYYLETSEDVADAAEVYFEKSGDKYHIYTKDGDKKNYIVAYTSGNYTDMVITNDLTEEAVRKTKVGKTNPYTADFTVDANGVVHATIGEKTYFLGAQTNKTYARLCIYEDSHIEEPTYKVAYFGTVKTKKYTKEEKAAYEKDKLTLDLAQRGGLTYTLPTAPQLFDDVTFTYEVKEGSTDYATIKDGVITFTPVFEDTNVTVVATIECNGTTTTKEFTFVVSPVEFKYASEVITKDTENGDDLFLKGVVLSVSTSGNGQAVITDGVTEVTIYGTLVGDIKYTDLTVGDFITVSGKYKLFGTTDEVETATIRAIKVEAANATDEMKARVTSNELALPSVYYFDTESTLAAAGTTHTTATIEWAVKGTSTTTKVEDGKLKVTQGAEDEDVVVVATITSGEFKFTREFSFTVYNVNAPKKATLAGTTSISNSNTNETTNYAAEVGLDPEIFTVKFAKNNSANLAAIGTSYVTIYKDKTSGNTNGSSLIISVKDGYKIESMVINYNTGKTGTLKVGETTLTAVSSTHKTDTVSSINATSVTLQDVGTDQVRIASIEITFSVVQNA